MEKVEQGRRVMQPVRVQEVNAEADLAAFRQAVTARFQGDARARPRDCSGRRFLVRGTVAADVEALAAEHGLRVQPDTREAFPDRT